MARSRSSYSGSGGGMMGRLVLIVLALVLLLVLAFGAFLATRPIPAPETGTERVIPDERFPR